MLRRQRKLRSRHAAQMTKSMDNESIHRVGASLFDGIASEELNELLNCANAFVLDMEKGDVLLREQDSASQIGVLLVGEVRATRLDPSGRQIIVSRHLAGSVFGDILSFNSKQKSPVTVMAHTDIVVLFIPFDWALRRCAKGCAARNLFKRIKNVRATLAERPIESEVLVI